MRAAVLALAVCAAGCGLTTQVRPTPKGVLQVEANVGGPLVVLGGTPIPLPLSTVGASYGLTDRLDLQAHAHLTTLAMRTLGLDAGASFLFLERGPWAVTGGARVYGFTDFRSSLWDYEELTVTGSYQVARWLPWNDTPLTPYATLTVGRVWDNRLVITPALGVRSAFGALAFQLELRWWDPLYDARLSSVPFISAGGLGAFGITLGAGYQFFRRPSASPGG